MVGACGVEKLPIPWLESKREEKEGLRSHFPFKGSPPMPWRPATRPYLFSFHHLLIAPHWESILYPWDLGSTWNPNYNKQYELRSKSSAPILKPSWFTLFVLFPERRELLLHWERSKPRNNSVITRAQSIFMTQTPAHSHQDTHIPITNGPEHVPPGSSEMSVIPISQGLAMNLPE